MERKTKELNLDINSAKQMLADNKYYISKAKFYQFILTSAEIVVTELDKHSTNFNLMADVRFILFTSAITTYLEISNQKLKNQNFKLQDYISMFE